MVAVVLNSFNLFFGWKKVAPQYKKVKMAAKKITLVMKIITTLFN